VSGGRIGNKSVDRVSRRSSRVLGRPEVEVKGGLDEGGRKRPKSMT